jgi:hypothetical protein
VKAGQEVPLDRAQELGWKIENPVRLSSGLLGCHVSVATSDLSKGYHDVSMSRYTKERKYFKIGTYLHQKEYPVTQDILRVMRREEYI